MTVSRYWGAPIPPSRYRPSPILVWQCALMLAVRRRRAQQAATINAGPRVDAAHYVLCSSATNRRARLRRAMAPRADARRVTTLRSLTHVGEGTERRATRRGSRDNLEAGGRTARRDARRVETHMCRPCLACRKRAITERAGRRVGGPSACCSSVNTVDLEEEGRWMRRLQAAHLIGCGIQRGIRVEGFFTLQTRSSSAYPLFRPALLRRIQELEWVEGPAGCAPNASLSLQAGAAPSALLKPNPPTRVQIRVARAHIARDAKIAHLRVSLRSTAPHGSPWDPTNSAQPTKCWTFHTVAVARGGSGPDPAHLNPPACPFSADLAGRGNTKCRLDDPP